MEQDTMTSPACARKSEVSAAPCFSTWQPELARLKKPPGIPTLIAKQPRSSQICPLP